MNRCLPKGKYPYAFQLSDHIWKEIVAKSWAIYTHVSHPFAGDHLKATKLSPNLSALPNNHDSCKCIVRYKLLLASEVFLDAQVFHLVMSATCSSIV